jgi:hypothetical protein
MRVGHAESFSGPSDLAREAAACEPVLSTRLLDGDHRPGSDRDRDQIRRVLRSPVTPPASPTCVRVGRSVAHIASTHPARRHDTRSRAARKMAETGVSELTIHELSLGLAH